MTEHGILNTLQSRAASLATWTARPLVLLLALTGVVTAALLWWGARSSDQVLRPRSSSAPMEMAFKIPQPPGNQLKPLTEAQAVAANTARPASTEPIEVASSFSIVTGGISNELTRRSALDCLAAAVYYEAGSETLQGQRAVAQVVLNRVHHPAFPKSICGVVYQGSERRTGCQFSFTCDGSLLRRPSAQGWERARMIASAALRGVVEPAIGMATHYHTVSVMPYWADSLIKLRTIGAHIFYRWPGFWGRRAAFTGRYAGEPESDGSVNYANEVFEIESTMSAGDAQLVLPAPKLIADDTKRLFPPVFATPGPALVADTKRSLLVVDEGAGVLKK